jgi:AraC-like DNA-binding protein
MLKMPMGRQGNKSPLFQYPLFQTKRLEEARDRVANVFCPHELRMVGPERHLDSYMYHAPIDGVSIDHLRYGADVGIDAGCLTDFLLVMMPLSGQAEVQCGHQRIRSNRRLASVVSPTLPLRETVNGDCDQIMIRIDRSLLERTCAQHLGRDIRRPIEFELGMDMTKPGCGSWLAMVAYLISECSQGAPTFASPLTRAQVEHLVVTTLLTAQPHTYREDMLRPAPPIAPRHVKRVEDYILTHADQPLTIGAMAAYAGVSTSSLFAGFRDFRGTSPMAYLKSVRLQRVRDDLQGASAKTDTVTNIAMRWGFRHLGHFTVDYKRKFGELPSDTLGK